MSRPNPMPSPTRARTSHALPLPLALTLAVVATLAGCSFGLDFDDLSACGEGQVAAEGGARCVCADDRVESALGECVCRPHSTVDDNGLCVCDAPRVSNDVHACVCGPTWLENPDGQCVCPAGTVPQGGFCECPPEAPRDAEGNCICRSEDGLGWDPLAGACSCLRADHALRSDGTCGCPAGMVDSAPGHTDSQCLCQVALGPDGGAFATRTSATQCTSELIDRGFLGRPERTPVDLTVVPSGDGQWSAALVEQDASWTHVTLYELSAATGNAELDIRETASARVARSDGLLVGVALELIDEQPFVLVLPLQGAPKWVDFEAQSFNDTVRADNQPWPEEMLNFAAIGWRSQREGRTFLLFNGAVAEPGGPLEWTAASTSIAGSPNDAGELPVVYSAFPLGVRVFESLGGGGDLFNFLVFNRPVPVLNSEGVFLAGGFEMSEPQNCPCSAALEARPMSWELTVDTRSGELVLVRRARDILEHDTLNQQLADMWSEYLGVGTAQDFFFQMSAIAGTGADVRGLAIPSFVGCVIGEALYTWRDCGQRCLGGRCERSNESCSTENWCLSTTAVFPIFEPALSVSLVRTADDFVTTSAFPLSEFGDGATETAMANKRVAVVDPTVIGADATRRLFLLTRQPLDERGQPGHELVLADIESERFSPLMTYAFEGPATSAFDDFGPTLFTAGPFVFIETNQGIRVLELRAL